MTALTLTVTVNRLVLDHLHQQRQLAGFDRVSDEVLAQILFCQGVSMERADMKHYIECAKEAA